MEDYELVYEDEYNNKQLCKVLCDLCRDVLNGLIDMIHKTRLGGFLQRSQLYTNTSEAVNCFDTFCWSYKLLKMCGLHFKFPF